VQWFFQCHCRELIREDFSGIPIVRFGFYFCCLTTHNALLFHLIALLKSSLLLHHSSYLCLVWYDRAGKIMVNIDLMMTMLHWSLNWKCVFSSNWFFYGGIRLRFFVQFWRKYCLLFWYVHLLYAELIFASFCSEWSENFSL